MEIVIRQSDRTSYLPCNMGGGWSGDTKQRLFVSFDSSYSVTVLRSNLGFAWILDSHGKGIQPITQRWASGRDNHQQKMKTYTTLQSKSTLSWTVFLSCVHQKITYKLFTMFLPERAAR